MGPRGTADVVPCLPAEAAPRLPAWVRALDVVAVSLVLLALRILLTGGIRIRFDDVRLSMMVWWRPVLLAVLVVALRHVFHRAGPLHHRVWSAIVRRWEAASVQAALPPFLISRLGVLAVGFVAVTTFGFNPPPPWRISDNELLNLPARWDSGWYLGIAADGYAPSADAHFQNPIAFFPGLPLLVRAVVTLTGASDPAGAFILVCLAFFWALTYVYRLAREFLPDERARLAILFMAFYPFAVYYSAIYTESIFLLAGVGAFYHARRGELARAGAFGLLAGLTRPNGVLLAVPLVLMVLIDALREQGWLDGRGRGRWRIDLPRVTPRLIAACTPVAGVLAYSAYVYAITGDPFAWTKAQQAWHRSFGELVNILDDRLKTIAVFGVYHYAREHTVELMEFAAGFFALGVSWPIARRFGAPFGAFVAICVIPPLISGGAESVGRYTSPLFPIFLWLAAVVPQRFVVYLVAGFAVFQGLVAALFFTWRPPF